MIKNWRKRKEKASIWNKKSCDYNLFRTNDLVNSLDGLLKSTAILYRKTIRDQCRVETYLHQSIFATNTALK